jgi:tetratricopeptide (TPR) repeat protein
MIMTRRCFLCLILIVFASAQPGASNAQDAAAPAGPDKINELLGDAQSLQGRKRYIDAFTKLDEAEKLDPKRPEIYNIRGAIHLALQVRDLDKAREQFIKARELSPDAMPPLFNLSEVEFVAQKWAAAEKGFQEVLTRFPKLAAGVRHLITFKVILSMVKQNKFAEAEKMAADNFSFMDDTPAYYFSKAVIALQKDDKRNGNDWLAKAQIIFKQQDNSAYLDSLMESHYIDSLATGGEAK